MIKFTAGFIQIATLVFLLGCSSGGFKKKITEGKISYDVSYDSITTRKYNPRLLPSSLTIEFKGNNTKTTIDALTGAISMSLIKNYDKQQYSTLIKFIGKKLQHTEPFDTSHYPALYVTVPKLNIIIKNKESCELYGFNCEKISGYFEDSTNMFDIIYTNDIKISNPNSNTPFEQIDGVMLEFNLYLKPITMQLKMSSISKTKIPKSTFEVSEEYCNVDYKTMSGIVTALMQN